MARTDILISGAGIAGLTAAALLAQRGFAVTIVDPAPPPPDPNAAGSDLRSTAYLAPSRDLLDRAGLWAHLAPQATPLRALRVIDSTGWPPAQTDSRTFTPDDLDLDAFGWNVPNWRARQVLTTALQDRGVDLRLGTGFAGMLTRSAHVRVMLTDGTRIEAGLVIGADGRASPVRQAAGIGADLRRYGQKAFALAVRHEAPHDDVSTEIYNSGGAFTTVPLPDHDGQPASAIVWMNDGPRAAALLAMDAATFGDQLNLRSLGVLGRMQVTTPIRTWPIVTQTARVLTARRVALVAEAAHVLPPIGAQGLNTSLADIASLTALLNERDPGAAPALDAYAATRARDMHLRAGAIDLFNRVCQSDNAAIQQLRLRGLRAVHDTPPVRRRIMQAGIGR